MENTDHLFNTTENQLITDQILQNDKSGRLSIEHYTQRFDSEFLICPEINDDIFYTNPLIAFGNETTKKNEKIKIIINHFSSLLDLSEAFLQRNYYKVINLEVMNFSLQELRRTLNRKCLCEIQRNCYKIICEFEQHMDEFIDKGCLAIILIEFRSLIGKLKAVEQEFTDSARQQDTVAD